jgi:hypothetical protein
MLRIRGTLTSSGAGSTFVPFEFKELRISVIPAQARIQLLQNEETPKNARFFGVCE